MVEELLELHKGVSNVPNPITRSHFDLKAHLLVVSGDGPASADASQMKHPGNAFSPCAHCNIKVCKHSRNPSLVIIII